MKKIFITHMFLFFICVLFADCKKSKDAIVNVEDDEEDVLDFTGDPTVLTKDQIVEWRNITEYTKDEITWQLADMSSLLKKDPLKDLFLPGKPSLEKNVSIKMTASEGESIAIYLVNPTNTFKKIPVSFTGLKGSNVKYELFIAGAIHTQQWGTILRPLFEKDNLPSENRLKKYLKNANVIKDFPMINLPARGTALVWVTLNTDNTPSGNYQGELTVDNKKISFDVNVINQQLPIPDLWVHTWNSSTLNFDPKFWNQTGTKIPFISHSALEKELIYMQRDLGITVWPTLPEANTDALIAKGIAERYGLTKPKYKVNFDKFYAHTGYVGELTEQNLDKPRINALVKQLKLKMEALKLSYSDFHLELWDEPSVNTLGSWAMLARAIKEVDPQIQLYINPMFWLEGKGFAEEKIQRDIIGNWYNDLVSVSVPQLGQDQESLVDLYNNKNRPYNVGYVHPCPGRWIAWESFIKGYNGWGFYGYYVPRVDPWDDFDTLEFDYAIVYPGPNGFIRTTQSESMRESYEDYRLLTLLRNQGKSQELERILSLYEKRNIENLPELREMLMDVITK